MKLVKIIFGVIVAVLVTIFAVAFMLPKTARMERSIVIQGDINDVYGYVNSLKKFSEWSPWTALDPNVTVEYSGPDEGVGAKMVWDSNVREVNSGMQTIIASEKNQHVQTELVFGDQGTGHASFELIPANDGVKVNWAFTTTFEGNPIARYFGLALEGMLAPYYEQGLAALKETVEALPAVQTEEITYSAGGAELTGYIAYPRNAENAPGVLVVHEWWGHNEYVRKRARLLAELGYVALALDMYGDGKVAEHPKEANAFMMEVVNNAQIAQERFLKAKDILQDHAASDPEKVAAIGYCFGGAVVLSMARAGVDLDGVVSFHGALGGLAPINKEDISAEFLVLNGGDDPFVTDEQEVEFKKSMDEAGVTYEFINYPGVVHAFTNPEATAKGEAYGLPLKYDQAADQDSWQRMQNFLQSLF